MAYMNFVQVNVLMSNCSLKSLAPLTLPQPIVRSPVGPVAPRMPPPVTTNEHQIRQDEIFGFLGVNSIG